MVNIDQKSISNEKDLNTQKLLCYLNLANVCLISNESKGDKSSALKMSTLPAKEQLDQPLVDVPMGEGQEPEKIQNSSPPHKTDNLEKDFGASFVDFFQAKENDAQSVSNWIYKMLEKLFEYFKSGQGTIYCTDNDNILKKNLNLEKISKNDIEYYTHTWSPIFRRNDITKREGNIFIQLDQDIFGSIVLFACSLMAYKFKITGKYLEFCS